jgi:hypothetical protein
MLRRIASLVAPLALSAGIAHAVDLSTPAVGSGPGRVVQCLVTNVGTTAAEVSIELFDPAGGEIVPAGDGCALTSPLAPHATCAVTALPGQVVACVIRSRSRNVRGAVEVFDGFDLVAVVPATAR